MEAKVSALVTGCASYVPGLRRLTARHTGGTTSARYCYTVWLRHLLRLRAHGLPTRFDTVVELGPGDSLGIGLAALLSGAERYVALDIVRYAEPQRNLKIFRELVALFAARTPVPDGREFPRVFPPLPDYGFPGDLLSAEWLSRLLDPARIAHLETLIAAPPDDPRSGARLCYVTPWRSDILGQGTADLIVSQSALEYSPDLRASYEEMARWLTAGGCMSHEIDFKSIGRTRSWNGHWACSDLTWRVMQGNRRNPLNRAPLSRHIALQTSLGLEVVGCLRNVRSGGIARTHLAPAFADLDDTDLTTASALIQSRKGGPSRGIGDVGPTGHAPDGA